jgi:carbon-monoxide dehydrogenase small subunit
MPPNFSRATPASRRMPRWRRRVMAYNSSRAGRTGRNITSIPDVHIKFTLNGEPVETQLKSGDRLLVDVLREDLQLTGTKHGCGIGACGTCTVIVDGLPVASCLQLAALVDGTDVRTVEGLASASSLHVVQQAFINQAAMQCGICTPGHVMAACALLEKTPAPTDEQIRTSVESVYCRCTGYVRIEAAYREAVALAQKARP